MVVGCWFLVPGSLYFVLCSLLLALRYLLFALCSVLTALRSSLTASVCYRADEITHLTRDHLPFINHPLNVFIIRTGGGHRSSRHHQWWRWTKEASCPRRDDFT